MKNLFVPKFAFLVCVFLFAYGLPAYAGQRAEEAIARQGDDELAPVRAIREEIRKRLAEPIKGGLDIDLIMEGPDFIGTQPRRVRWDSDGSRLWFEWKRWDEEEPGTYEYDLNGGGLRRLGKDEAEEVPSPGAVWDRDRNRAIWSVRSDIRLYDGEEKKSHTLISGLRGARPLGFTPDGTTALLMLGGNLVAVEIKGADGVPIVRQLTDIRSGRPPRKEPKTEGQRWLKQQQLELFDVLNRRDRKAAERKERAESLSPAPLYLEGWKVDRIVPSPDLAFAAVFERRDAPSDRVADVPDYVTISGYTEDIPTRTKVGDDLASRRVGIIEIASGRVGWADFGLGKREITAWRGEWSPDGDRLLVALRAMDNKDFWLAVLEPQTEEVAEGEPEKGTGSRSATKDVDALVLRATLLAHDHDDAWINGAVMRSFGWFPDGAAAWFVSERSGKMHLYTVPADGGEVRALTQGDFIVSSPRLTPDRSKFVFSATIPGPFESQTYLLALDGGRPRPITEGMGRADAVLSPDGRRLAIVASNGDVPWELYVKEIGGPGIGTKVTDSPSPAFKSYRWIKPKIIRFTAEDGASIPARLYLPERPDPDRPAVIFVHGAGYMHNVHNWWSSYSREYCFHHLLMERGYTVLDIDYRGSAGYGRDWRTAIYRHMGGKDLSDQVDGARYLVAEHGIDPERIGLYGGSYGGFITLMALFTAGDHFAAGAALRPVTDWAAYSQWYTGSILNTPAEDPEAYYRSSPIYFAEGLEDPLLICHGVVDTNVHFQDTVRLAQRLIELRKRNWEVAIYPVENHGFREPSSWADEYSRILKLFEENLKGTR